jgi:hypothetical protein
MMKAVPTAVFQVTPGMRSSWQILGARGYLLAAFEQREDALLYAIDLAKAEYEACVELYSSSGQLVSRDHYRGRRPCLDRCPERRV